jgi:putative drug exporter of the RND superfamily
MLVMLTLLPALMVVFPRGIFWPYRPAYGSAEPTTRGTWARVGWGIAIRPRLTWIITAVILGVLAIGLTGLKANGLTTAQGFRGHPDSVTGQTVLTEHFPAGAGEPVIVIGNARAVLPLRSALTATPGIAAVTPPAVRAGYAYLEGTLTSPPDSQTAYATVDRVRTAVHAVPGADAKVGGFTAINLDVQRADAHDRDVVIPLILVVVFVILGLILRALVAPLILTATVVLSFAAALGVSAVFFNHVFGFGGADTSFPLLAFVFLVALGIDYNIFLMTRVREEAIKRDTRHGAIIGLAATGGVITSAGFVLAGTFAVLATIPATFLTEIGFAVAFGILLDTIVVRSVLVTALNLDIGRWMWWPSALTQKPDPAPEELSQERAALVPLGSGCSQERGGRRVGRIERLDGQFRQHDIARRAEHGRRAEQRQHRIPDAQPQGNQDRPAVRMRHGRGTRVAGQLVAQRDERRVGRRFDVTAKPVEQVRPPFGQVDDARCHAVRVQAEP